MLYLQFKAAMTDILVAHHLSIIADLEPMKATKHRADAFAAVDHAIAVFEKVCRKFCRTTLSSDTEDAENFLLLCHAYDSIRCDLLDSVDTILQTNILSNVATTSLDGGGANLAFI